MKLEIPGKFTKEHVDKLEQILKGLFPNVEGGRGCGKDYISREEQIPYDNRFMQFSKGEATVTYYATSAKGDFEVKLQLQSVNPEELMEHIRKEIPEIYSAIQT